MKESPRPPRTFLEFIIDGATARARFRKTANTPAPRAARVTPPPKYLLDWYCKRRPGTSLRWARGLLPCSDAPSGSARGCKGRSPLHEITLILPLPRRGRGSGGMGARKHTEGKVSRRQKRQAPPCAPLTPRPRAAGDKPPAGRVVCSPAPVPPPAQPRGCKGRSPLHEITIVSPFPPGRGSGGWGKESTLKAGIAGDQKGKPPPPPPKNHPLG